MRCHSCDGDFCTTADQCLSCGALVCDDCSCPCGVCQPLQPYPKVDQGGPLDMVPFLLFSWLLGIALAWGACESCRMVP